MGGVAGLETAGSILRALSAADEDELEIVDIVRVRASCFTLPPPKNREEGAGSVATECSDEMDPFRDRIQLVVDASDDDWWMPAEYGGEPERLGDAVMCT